MDKSSLAHTKWICKYHIVFAPKYRRQFIYGKLKREIGKIIRELCERKGVEIIEAEACPDHIHMLVSIPPKLSVSKFMGYLKGKSSLMIFDKFANMKYRYGNRQFWCRGYFVDTVGRNKKEIYPSEKDGAAVLLASPDNPFVDSGYILYNAFRVNRFTYPSRPFSFNRTEAGSILFREL